jgi:hypothetical protein
MLFMSRIVIAVGFYSVGRGPKIMQKLIDDRVTVGSVMQFE